MSDNESLSKKQLTDKAGPIARIGRDVEEINHNLRKLTSYKEAFKHGIIRGLGVAIGATIVAAVAFAIFNVLIDSVNDLPLIRDIINQTNVQEAVDNFRN